MVAPPSKVYNNYYYNIQLPVAPSTYLRLNLDPLTSFFSSGSALLFISNFTIDLLPTLAAKWSAVSPALSVALTHVEVQRFDFKISFTKSSMPDKQA